MDYLEKDMHAIKLKLFNEPFDRNTSVIMFGVTAKKNEDLDLVVEGILVGALKVDVNVVVCEHASPCNNKPGAIKVELASVYEKIAVLRAKQQLNSHDKYDKVRIRSCESQSDRVNRLNTSEMLKIISHEN